MKQELNQEIFNNQPQEVNWAGVDYDGTLNFGVAVNPRYTWASEQWRGFKQIGDSITNSGYQELSQITKTNNHGMEINSRHYKRASN